jgi:hypothetical protein
MVSNDRLPKALLIAAAVLLIGGGTAAAELDPIVLPIKLRGNFPIVTVSVAGRPVALEFDSGNSGSLNLIQSVIDQAKGTPTGEVSRGIDAKGNVIEYPRYKISTVAIGGAVFSSVVAELDVHDPSYQAAEVGQRGFLGTALLKGYRVVLDYPHRRMILLPPGTKAAACEGVPVAFSPAWHGEPATQVSIDSGSLTVWWDTGSPIGVLSKRFADAAALHTTGTHLVSEHFILSGVDFGSVDFQVLDVAFPFDGAIGYNFFSHHVVCMDFPAKRLVIPH